MESIDIKKISNISILLTGFSKTGKSTLLSHFTGESLGGFSGQITNISMECIQKEISIDTNKTINVTFWDTPGQKRFRAIVANAVIKMQGIMLIFDVTSKESFTIIEKLIDNFKETIDIATIPISIVGNKIDLEDKRVVSYDEAMKFAEDNRFRYYETSAQSGEGIKEAFTDLIVNAYYKVNLIVKKEEQVNQIDNKKENNEKYTGEYKYSKKEGNGRYFFKNGDVFEGIFFDGNPHGEGRYESDDIVYKSFWRNGQMVEKPLIESQKSEDEIKNIIIKKEDIDFKQIPNNNNDDNFNPSLISKNSNYKSKINLKDEAVMEYFNS